ncbi:DUF2020 domain-containing protein [Allokutzneria oryzae]|uniref:DUF2020 domain-containing protein n=1 Tax=Allokutzneria oryzae TaxID=1378989 RepID=A0ABV6A0A3_9PSEU
MRRHVLVAVPVVLLAVGCSGESGPGEGGATSSAAAVASSSVAPAQAPASPEPTANGPCPYLSDADVAQFNGQHVGKVRVSADKPHPACFFYRPNGEEQLRVQVYVGTPEVAKALVDAIAPVATSSPVTIDGGWKGGAQLTEKGSVFAVANGGKAVAAVSNQKRTIAPKRAVEKATSAMG